MDRRLTVIVATVLVFVGVAALLLLFGSMGRGADGGAPLFGPRVAIVELEGLIAETDDLVRELRQHRDNPSVRAVVIRINSPGGVVAPTQEVYDALLRVREAGKPVVASLGAVAASGGYYAAVAADQIYANPGTLTGSIGVIMQLANVDTLLKKVGVDFVVVKAGQFKDIGNPARAMTPEERRVVQSLLEDVHGQFIEAVARGRKLERSAVVQFADGRVFSGTQALGLRMIDALGGLEDAVNAAAKLANLPTPPPVERPRRKFSIFDLVRNELGLALPAALLPQRLPLFKTPLYLMD
ncbi:MAG TPA: signal peptide peptidase SppA [Methylomirabilota bacterium]|nr:signal peptide peptidase SppA [Methylomirabilota bacterium]